MWAVGDSVLRPALLYPWPLIFSSGSAEFNSQNLRNLRIIIAYYVFRLLTSVRMLRVRATTKRSRGWVDKRSDYIWNMKRR